MTTLLAFFASLFGFACRGAEPARQWETFVLWDNSVLSASLKYLPEATFADEDYMFVEFDNHTDKPLEGVYAWVYLPATRTNKETKTTRAGEFISGVVYTGQLLPGKTKARQRGVFEAGLEHLGLPPKEGLHVEGTPKAEARLKDGTTFSNTDGKRTFAFEFLYPNPAQVKDIKARYHELLAHPDHQVASGSLFRAWSNIPEVTDSITRDEALMALKTRSWMDGKEAVLTIVGKRFPNDPEILTYLVKQFYCYGGNAFHSFPPEVWQNPVFIEPLVWSFEMRGENFGALQATRSTWGKDPAIVRRMVTAVFKKYPVLRRDVTALSSHDLPGWRSGVEDAGNIGDRAFLPWLVPALDDSRIVPDDVSKFSSRYRLPWQPRVCDCAAEAILQIVDGNGNWSAFQKPGTTFLLTQEEDYAMHERIINYLKERLARFDGDQTK